MKFDSEDLLQLRPLILGIVAEVTQQIAADRERVAGRLGYTEPEAAALLGVPRHVLRDARRRGEIDASKLGKRIVYKREALEAYLEGQQLR